MQTALQEAWKTHQLAGGDLQAKLHARFGAVRAAFFLGAVAGEGGKKTATRKKRETARERP